MFSRFPTDARVNPGRSTAGSGSAWVNIKAWYASPKSCLQRPPTRERCLEAYHLHRTRFELIPRERFVVAV
jgi:hypothetical protein